MHAALLRRVRNHELGGFLFPFSPCWAIVAGPQMLVDATAARIRTRHGRAPLCGTAGAFI